MGTNLNWMVDWDPEKLAADLMYQARPWATGDGNGSNTANWTAVDDHGWPIVSLGTDFGAIFEADPWPGTYKLSFKNRQGTAGDMVTSYSGNIQLLNRSHDAASNVTSYDIVVPSFASGQFIWLIWNGATGGVTEVHLMRPLKDGSGWHQVGTVLSDHVKDRLAWFTTIRTMQTGGYPDLTTGSDTKWAGRTKPWSSQQRSSDALRPGGAAIELLVAMANEAGKDLWINIPFRASDDYIRKMARVIRYGSDGHEPYSSVQADPVFAPLDPSLRLYVEHGNEIWNPGPGYWEGENLAAANAERASGDPNDLEYRPSDSGQWGYAWRRTGYLAVRHSLIFREVFGDDAMMTRVRPVLATQHARYGTTSEPLDYIRDVWGRGYDSLVDFGQTNQYGHAARPVNYYLYALATALYFPNGNGTMDPSSPASLIQSTLTDLDDAAAEGLFVALAWNKARADEHGIRYVAYEGGSNHIPELMPGGATASALQNARLANYDTVQGAGMGARLDGSGYPAADQSGFVYGRVFAEWARIAGGLFMHFTLGQAPGAGGTFGLCPPSDQSPSDPRLETGPKWTAVKAFVREWSK